MPLDHASRRDVFFTRLMIGIRRFCGAAWGMSVLGLGLGGLGFISRFYSDAGIQVVVKLIRHCLKALSLLPQITSLSSSTPCPTHPYSSSPSPLGHPIQGVQIPPHHIPIIHRLSRPERTKTRFSRLTCSDYTRKFIKALERNFSEMYTEALGGLYLSRGVVLTRIPLRSRLRDGGDYSLY